MTVAERLLKEIIEKKDKIFELRDELTETESNLVGMEIEHESNYAVVEHIDAMEGQVTLYVEDEDGDSWNEMISIYELLDKL